MEFKRGRKADTDVMTRMQWESRCGDYRVSHVKLIHDSDHYLAEHKLPATGSWWPIEWAANRKGNHAFKKYRTRRAAEEVCTNHKEDR
jgi:hypothetical protein